MYGTDFIATFSLYIVVLAKEGDDIDALHCKLIALLQLERFGDAASLVLGAAALRAEDASKFACCYALYRGEQYDECAKLLHTLDDSVEHVQALKSQLV